MRRGKAPSLLVVLALGVSLACGMVPAGALAQARAQAGGLPASVRDAPADGAGEKGGGAAAGSSAFAEGIDYVSGEVVVGFEGEGGAAEASEVLSESTTVDGGAASAEAVSDDTAVVDVADDATVPQAVAELERTPGVAYAQPNFIYHVAAALSDDPMVGEQWYLDDLQARGAWDLQRGSDGGVAVAVIDTGCDAGHPDLAGNVVGAYNVVDSNADVTDSVGHGTAVCGVVSAVSDNATGISGVSYNAKVVPIKASVSGATFTSATVVAAISYAREHEKDLGIRVVNLSMSGRSTSATRSAEKAVSDAIDAAFRQGILVVCAAGNSSPAVSAPYASYPGDCDECLSVMAVNSAHVLHATSNYNVAGSAAKNLCAPGVDVCTLQSRSRGSGLYQTLSGTSLAAPMVSAVAALCFDANPSLDAAGCASILCDTAADLGDAGWDERYGYGEVNARAAVERAKAAATGVPVLRLYNPYDGDHLFTTDGSERDALVPLGWRDEGVAWESPASGDAVYRLYNPWSGEHLYTADAAELSRLTAYGWSYEGVAIRSAVSGTAVYRLYNPWLTVGTHLYTRDAAERDLLVSLGWRCEGAALRGL